MAIRKLMLFVTFLCVTICLSACGSTANNGPKVIEETQMKTTTAEETESEATVEETTEAETTKEETQQETEAETKEVIVLQSFESLKLQSDISEIVLYEKSTDAIEKPLKIYKQKEEKAKLNFSYVGNVALYDIRQGIILELNQNVGGLGIVNNIGNISTFSLELNPYEQIEEKYNIIYEIRFEDDSRWYMAIEVTMMADDE